MKEITIDIENYSLCEDSVPMHPYVLESELDHEELERIAKILEDMPHQAKFQIEGESSLSSCWIDYVDKDAWLYGRICQIAEYVNRAYKFNDLVMIEKIAYVELNPLDFHNFNTDLGSGVPFSSRKLCIMINISASDDYRNGDLEFMTGRNPYRTSRAAGSVIVFPAYMLKRFTQVTKGTRKVLTAWLSSPNK